jgi:hypothetical protein
MRLYCPWKNRVIPLAVKVLGFEGNGGEDRIWDAKSDGVRMGIQASSDMQTSLGSCVADELDDGLVIDQGAGAPVLSDMAEEAVLDLVPLAGARRKMWFLWGIRGSKPSQAEE